jgi:Flp pilus assembly protein TadD
MLSGCLLLLFATTTADFNQQFQAGLVALNDNNLTQARQKLESASRLQPRNPEVWVALAQTYRRMKSKQLAEAAASKAEQFAARSPAAMHALAIYYSQADNFEKAANLESRYAATNESASADAAVLWFKAGKPKAAIEYGKRAVAREDRGDLHALLAESYEADGQFENGAVEYQRAIQMSPYEETYYSELAQAYLRHRQFAATVELLERGLIIFDKSAQLEMALGVGYYGEGRFADATNAFLRTIQLDPKVGQPYMFLGKMLDQAGARTPDVVLRIGNWAVANPADARALFTYGKALIVSGGDEGNAETLLRNSIMLKNDRWESHYQLGVLLEKQRKFAEAAAELERSIAIDSKQADAHDRLARVYDQLGAPDKAAQQRNIHQQLTALSGLK